MLTQKYSDHSINEYSGLSTDRKPHGCPNGSRFNEIDTDTTYLYDAETDTWHISQDGE